MGQTQAPYRKSVVVAAAAVVAAEVAAAVAGYSVVESRVGERLVYGEEHCQARARQLVLDRCGQ